MQRGSEAERTLRQTIVGSTLRHVTYEQLKGGGLAGQQANSVHEVDTAVYLDLDRVSIMLTWEHPDRDEFLAIEIGPPAREGQRLAGSDTVMLNASHDWRELIGRKIVSVSFGWQVGEVGASDNLWSVRLSFGNERNVTCCLGELSDGVCPVYSAEGLLVFFDESAVEYSTAGSIGSAWGDPV